MKGNLSALLVGFIFALGLGISGMTQPERVISFLDIFGNWNPSLIFVMGGALAIHIVSFRFIMQRRSPLFAPYFHVPKRRDIDSKLIFGAMLFGIGWGLVGYCPAPAITALAGFSSSSFVFVASMMSGMVLYIVLDKVLTKKKAT